LSRIRRGIEHVSKTTVVLLSIHELVQELKTSAPFAQGVLRWAILTPNWLHAQGDSMIPSLVPSRRDLPEQHLRLDLASNPPEDVTSEPATAAAKPIQDHDEYAAYAFARFANAAANMA
jgi:hypothetical protein